MATTLGHCLPDVQQKVVQAARQQAWRDRGVVARSAGQVLRSEWPQTYNALVATYFPLGKFDQTYIREPQPGQPGQRLKCNDAGYMLRGLVVFLERATAQYGQLQPTAARLDPAAAREVLFQWQRGRQPIDARPYLIKCWLSLLVERPERIWPERYR